MAENVAVQHRLWTGMALHLAYPLGMLYLAGAAFMLPAWRELQLALTVPAVYLLVNIV